MKIEIEREHIVMLVTSFCQFLVEEGQHNNLRESERKALANFINIEQDDISGDHILNLSGYQDPKSNVTPPISWHY